MPLSSDLMKLKKCGIYFKHNENRDYLANREFQKMIKNNIERNLTIETDIMKSIIFDRDIRKYLEN